MEINFIEPPQEPLAKTTESPAKIKVNLIDVETSQSEIENPISLGEEVLKLLKLTNTNIAKPQSSKLLITEL